MGYECGVIFGWLFCVRGRYCDVPVIRQSNWFTCMVDSQGRGNASLEAGNGVQARGRPVREQVRDNLGRLAGADRNEVAVAQPQLDLGVGGFVGVEELELDAARGEDVLAGLGEVIEDEHRGADGGVAGRHC